MVKHTLTIITPVYNRAEIIRGLYESLCNQLNKDFVWLIVDDGSTDNIKDYIAQISKESIIDLKYCYKCNGGKHTALNYAHDYIDSEIICVVDSDDSLTEDAVKEIITQWKCFKDNSWLGELVFPKMHKDGTIISKNFPSEVTTMSHYERLNNNINCDCCEVVPTSLFKKYLFPEVKGEKFIGEGYLWNCIAIDGYKEVFINKPIYICEYLDGGLSKSGKNMRMRNPLGGMINSNLFLKKSKYGRYKSSILIKKAVLYAYYGIIAHVPRKKIISESENPYLVSFCYWLGYILYKYWGRKYGK